MERQTFIATVLCMAAMLSLSGCTRELPIYTTRSATAVPFIPASFRSPATSSIPLDSWMAAIPGDYNLAQLSLPGAHNACARYEPMGGIARCQSLTIRQQLNAGIRFLDIRCRHTGNTFVIHHGSIYQKQDFEDVLRACVDFLDRHPSECIIMSIKEEYNPANNTRSFEQTFDKYVQRYAGKWYLGATVPVMSQVRGRIVLLRRFEAQQLPKGIDASNWGRNATFTISRGPTQLRVQDQFVVPDNRAKWRTSAVLLAEASALQSEALYINFTSGYRPALFRIPKIRPVADAMSANIIHYFTAHPQGRFGIVVMDFADVDKASLIITTNFRPGVALQQNRVQTYVLNNGQ